MIIFSIVTSTSCNIDEARKAAARFDTPVQSQASAKTEMPGTGLFRILYDAC